MLGQPHHDGSELHVLEQPGSIGGDATVRLRTSRGAADRVLLRYTRDGEPRTVEAIVDEESEQETWWRATFPVANPATRYRWLLAGGDTGYGWLTGNGVASHEVPSSDDFVMSLGTGPDWHLSAVVYEGSSRSLRLVRRRAHAARLGGSPRLGRAADGPRAGDPA